MQAAMQSLQAMVDVNTVVGDAVETKGGAVIVPVSQVSFGFAAGGGEYGSERQAGAPLPFGGGSGAGVSVRPVGFLVVQQGSVRLLPVDQRAAVERLLDVAPELLDRLLTALGRQPQSLDGHRLAAEEAGHAAAAAALPPVAVPSADGTS